MRENIYDRRFWLCYASNLLFLIANTILVRYSDFVRQQLGSDRPDLHLGMIVGFGAVGAVALRLLLGRLLDSVGAGRVWRVSLLVYITALVWHLQLESADSPGVYLARLLLATATAGVVGGSLTFATLRVRDQRASELVAVLGSSGFVGLAIGPFISDMLLGSTPTASDIPRMFAGSITAAALALLLVLLATWGHSRRPARRRRNLPALGVIYRYQPGLIVLVGIIAGFGIMLPQTFLRPLAEDRELGGVRLFFLVYASVAFTARILSRRAVEQWGHRKVLYVGCSFLAMSMLAYVPATTQAWLLVPAVAGGVSHALLFPAIVSGSTLAYPARYRGVATVLILGALDIGTLFGQPVAGSVVTLAREFGLPPYAILFSASGTVMVLAGWIASRARVGIAGQVYARRRSANVPAFSGAA